MKLKALDCWPLRIPLKVSFKHASAERVLTESIWVEAKDDAGLTGYGEGCPRSYVTGESLESCRAAIREWRGDLLQNCASVSDLRAWVGKHSTEIDRAPAAWCAVELAVLDLLARRSVSTVEALVGLPPLSGVFHYTAVLGDQDERTFASQLRQYRQWGFAKFKVKLSDDRAKNLLKCEMLREANIPRESCRADANNLWPDYGKAIMEFAPIAQTFHAVEEPLRAGDLAGMKAFARECKVAMVLDESLLRIEQLPALSGDPQTWILNLRVSKLGGLFRSLRMAGAAVEQGMRVIVGAQVGETSLLTRAGLTVASVVGANLYAQEGAFGTHLLAAEVSDPPLMFGARGELSVGDTGPLKVQRPREFLQA